jgi:hypothetical protein
MPFFVVLSSAIASLQRSQNRTEIYHSHESYAEVPDSKCPEYEERNGLTECIKNRVRRDAFVAKDSDERTDSIHDFVE